MSLQRGPFRQGSAADVSTGSGYYDFTYDAIALAGELNATAAGWDPFISDLALLAAGPADPTLGVDDAALAISIAAGQRLATLPNLDAVIDAFNVADPLLAIAIGFAPAAAWSTPTAPFAPADPTQTLLTPTIDQGGYNPSVTGVVGGVSTSARPAVTLQNLTRVGELNFVVGDTYLLNVFGAPGQEVSVDGQHDGVPFPRAVFGTTDPQGNYGVSGIEGPDAIGGWLENWYIGGQLVETFNFIVSPGN